MEFYTGQLLNHDHVPGVFRVLAVGEDIELVKYFRAYEDGKSILAKSQRFWPSKAR